MSANWNMRQIDEMIESDTQTLRAHAIYNKANIDVFDQKRNQSNRNARFFKKARLFLWAQFLKKTLLTKKQIESTQSWTIIQTTVRPLSLQHFTFGSVENVVKKFLKEHSYSYLYEIVH